MCDPFTATFTHPMTQEQLSLNDAVNEKYISAKSTYVTDYTGGVRYNLLEAMEARLIDPKTGPAH